MEKALTNDEPIRSTPSAAGAMSSRSEGVALRPFSELQALEDFLDANFTLEVASNSAVDLVPHGSWLGLAGSDIQQLGVKIKIDDVEKLRSLFSPIVMNLTDVSAVLVVLDRSSSVLRESIVLGQMGLDEISNELIVNRSGSVPPHRILSNRRTGFRIELAFVQNKDVPGNNPTRPRKKGALIVKAAWDVKPVADGDVFQPKVLTDEIRAEKGLLKNEWVYFEAKSALLSGTTFSDAAAFYVDEKLLGQMQLLTGETKRLAGMMLYNSAMTSLIYELSLSFGQPDFSPDEEELSESSIMRILRIKFKEQSDQDLIEYVRDEPSRALAEFLANPLDFRKFMEALEGLNGGTNELPDFED